MQIPKPTPADVARFRSAVPDDPRVELSIAPELLAQLDEVLGRRASREQVVRERPEAIDVAERPDVLELRAGGRVKSFQLF